MSLMRHLSIKKKFSFDFVSSDTILKEIVSLDANRATYSNDVPTKNVKANSDSFQILYLILIMSLAFPVVVCLF